MLAIVDDVEPSSYTQSDNDKYRLIQYSDDASTIKCPWTLPLLVGQNVTGDSMEWQIAFDGVSLITRYGRSGSDNFQTVTRAVTTNQSGRDIYEQSLIEGKKRYNDKCHEGYHLLTDDAISSLQTLVKPMLAYEYAAQGKQLRNWPYVLYQPKLDGIRALISQQATGILRLSRSNKPFSFMEHLHPECQRLLSFLPSGTVLDGELYNHDLSFEEITSIVRQKLAPHPNEKVMQYWVFDIIIPNSGLIFEERYTLLQKAYQSYLLPSTEPSQITNIDTSPIHPYIRLVDVYSTYEKDTDYLYSLRDIFESNGYEGLMLRKPGSVYVHGRTTSLFKVKRFITAEAVVVNVFAGQGTEAGCANFILYDPEINGFFPVRPSGSFEQRAIWLQNPTSLIGQAYTYKCFSRKPGELPRFPIGVGFRDYE